MFRALEKVFFSLAAGLLGYYFVITLSYPAFSENHKIAVVILFTISLGTAWFFHVKKMHEGHNHKG